MENSWKAILAGPGRTVFVALLFGVWLHAADSTVIATLMPDIIEELGGEALLSWNFVLYRLATLIAACCGAMIGRRIGLRPACVYAALCVAIGCSISALANSMDMMLVGRTIQGLGGGLLVALVTIGVASLFPGNLTPRIMAAISAVWGSSAFIGPLIGGLFAEYGDWRYGFWAFTAQAILLAILLFYSLPKQRQVHTVRNQIPFRRLFLLSCAIMAVAVAGVGAGVGAEAEAEATDEDGAGITLWAIFLCLAGGGGLWGFLCLDRRADDRDRLLPKPITHLNHPVGIGFTGIFMIAVVSIPFSVYGPVLMHGLHGVSPLMVGYMIAVESVSWTVGALIFAGWSEARQMKLIRVSFCMILVSTAGLAYVVTPGPAWAPLPFLFLAGLGFGSCFGHILQKCVESADKEDKDRVAGAITTVQTVGYSLGAAICGLVANSVGYGDGAPVEAARSAGYWIFITMLPLSILSIGVIWKLR